MTELFASWWAMTSAYFAAPLTLFSGTFQPVTLLPAFGIVFLVLGVVVALLTREKKLPLLIPPLILTLLTPVVIYLGNTVLGWFGLLFVLVAGGVGLLIWIAVIAGDATRRLPIWLIGLFLLSFVAYCALIAIALIWGV